MRMTSLHVQYDVYKQEEGVQGSFVLWPQEPEQ